MTTLKVRYALSPAPIKFANAMLFNLSWFAVVFTHSPVIAPLVVMLHLVLHWWQVNTDKRELVLIALVLALGIVVDQLVFRAGVFTVAGQPALPPLWMTCLWPVLATTLMHAFESLQRMPLLAGVFGAVGGALSYLAGTRLTDVEFASAVWGPAVLGALWLFLFPLLLRCAAWLKTWNRAGGLA